MKDLSNIYSTKNACIQAFEKFNSINRNKLNNEQNIMLDNTINNIVLYTSVTYNVALF